MCGVYINSKRSKKTAPAVPALADQQASPTPLTPTDVSRLPKALREDSAIQNRRYTDSGFRIRGAVGNEGGSSSLLEEAFFSELRVITMKTKKYSTLKTTTTD